MITDLPKERTSDNKVTNISKSFAHKMAAKTSWNEITSLSPNVLAFEENDDRKFLSAEISSPKRIEGFITSYNRQTENENTRRK